MKNGITINGIAYEMQEASPCSCCALCGRCSDTARLCELLGGNFGSVRFVRVPSGGPAAHVKTAEVPEAGKARKEKAPKKGGLQPRKYPSDLTGMRFGKLTVLKKAGTSGSASVWEVRCDCGTVKTMLRPNLTRAKSCGCSRDGILKEGRRKLAALRDAGAPEKEEPEKEEPAKEEAKDDGNYFQGLIEKHMEGVKEKPSKRCLGCRYFKNSHDPICETLGRCTLLNCFTDANTACRVVIKEED